MMSVSSFPRLCCLFITIIIEILILVNINDATDCITAPYSANSETHDLRLQDLKLLGCKRVRRFEEPPIHDFPENVTSSPPGISKEIVGIFSKDIPLSKTKSNANQQSNVSKQQHNLGENGTGVHYTHISVSEPINPDDALNLDDFSEPQEKFLHDHNLTQIRNDTHEYYNSSMVLDLAQFDKYWNSLFKNDKVTTRSILNHSHRRAVTVPLSFDFPFYGHYVKNVTVASGGFINTGWYIHSWLAATQYIAPLMANFDTTLHEDSTVKYIDNGTAFTVVWENVSLQGNNTDQKFTFATTLFKNGDITFAYKNLPIPIHTIQDESHPIKIGLSDAYIIDRVLQLIHRKTIYEYHKIDFRSQPISNGTMITLSTLPTCPQYHSCESCMHHDTVFECAWCESIRRCSNGEDRHRQDWMTKLCEQSKVMNISKCSIDNENPKNSNIYITDNKNTSTLISVEVLKAGKSESSAGAIVTCLSILIIIGSIGAWILYAYRNPHTNSGQLLVKYRPSQWRWRRGEARYTAATIHM